MRPITVRTQKETAIAHAQIDDQITEWDGYVLSRSGGLRDRRKQTASVHVEMEPSFVSLHEVEQKSTTRWSRAIVIVKETV